MKKLLFLLLAPFAILSCRGPKVLSDSETKNTKDTVILKDTVVTVKNIPVYIKGDSIVIKDTIKELPKNFKKSKEVNAGKTTAKYTIKDQQITIECNTASYEDTIAELKVKLKTSETRRSEVTVKTKVVEKLVYIPVVPNWCKILVGANVLALLIWLQSKGILGSIIKKLF